MKLLIVDDSNIIRKAIQKYTVKYNVEVVGQADNGKVAVELFQQYMPDLVTLDITMQEMDGLTALEEMMKINDNAKVIIISALSDKQTALDAMEKGAVAFLQKPFTEEKLDSILSKYLG
jgi:two-component system chemotaxis response regulator CheY